MNVHIVGRPDAGELAAVLAVLARSEQPSPRDPLAGWRATRQAALRRTLGRRQQTPPQTPRQTPQQTR